VRALPLLLAGLLAGVGVTAAHAACLAPPAPASGSYGTVGLVGSHTVFLQFPAFGSTSGDWKATGAPPGIHVAVLSGSVVVSGTPLKAGSYTTRLVFDSSDCPAPVTDGPYFFTVQAGGGAVAATGGTTTAAKKEVASALDDLGRFIALFEVLHKREVSRGRAEDDLTATKRAIGLAAEQVRKEEFTREQVDAVIRAIDAAGTVVDEMQMTVEEPSFSPATEAPELTKEGDEARADLRAADDAM
jgi:hypothetical protein